MLLCRYAAKLPGEGAAMYEAAEALKDAMLALGLACDGGKDSVSMVARAGDEVPARPSSGIQNVFIFVGACS